MESPCNRGTMIPDARPAQGVIATTTEDTCCAGHRLPRLWMLPRQEASYSRSKTNNSTEIAVNVPKAPHEDDSWQTSRFVNRGYRNFSCGQLIPCEQALKEAV